MYVRTELDRLIVAAANEGFVCANASEKIKDFVIYASMQR